METKPFLLGILLGGLILAGCSPVTTTSSSPDESSSTSSGSALSSESGSSSSISSSSGSSSQADYETKTVAELIALAAEHTDSASEERYYVRATVDEVSDPKNGGMTISDDTGSIEVFRTYSSDGKTSYGDLEEKPVAGDEVVLYGNLQTYKGTAEIYSGWIMEFTHVVPDIDPDEYELSTLKEAHEAKDGTILKVEGTVLRHTFNSSLNEIGFILGDATGTAYVYDSQIAPQVEDGEKVTLVASKDYWILDDEQDYAEKNGYLGANQLTNAILVSHSEGSAFDYDAASSETTVKDLMEAPFSSDCTGLLYKVNAHIKKDVKYESSGAVDFTNYYIYDLDGTTGTYTYTQADGNDFAWLDAYDGKNVILYMTVLNAKMSASGGNWRFLPIEVSDEAFSFSASAIPEFVVEYYGLKQIQDAYYADPSAELTTVIGNDVIPFTGATLSFSSNNASVISIVEENGKTVLHAHTENPGKATITVSGAYGSEKAYSTEVEVEVINLETMPALTVSEAIASSVDESKLLTVRATVGPSLLNQPGFYLIDDSGIIAVRLTSYDAFDGSFEIGDKVIVQGYRNLWGNKDSEICLSDATVFANLYGGDGTYPTSSFISGKTISDLLSYDVFDPTHTAEAYILEGVTVNYVKTGYQPTYTFSDTDGNALSIYCSGEKQLSWLAPFVDKTVTVEVALCKWNTNGSTTVCPLAVIDEEGTKTVNTYNFPA